LAHSISWSLSFFARASQLSHLQLLFIFCGLPFRGIDAASISARSCSADFWFLHVQLFETTAVTLHCYYQIQDCDSVNYLINLLTDSISQQPEAFQDSNLNLVSLALAQDLNNFELNAISLTTALGTVKFDERLASIISALPLILVSKVVRLPIVYTS
jgi:hypothetical protein